MITPPNNPQNGDTYVVGAGATGAWVGHDGQMTRWDGSSSQWLFYVNGSWSAAAPSPSLPPDIPPGVQVAPSPSPPANPNDGDTYVVPAGGTAAWKGHDGQLTRWEALYQAWSFYVNGGWYFDPGTANPPTDRTYPPPVATATVLGGVKIGANIHVTSDGVISIDPIPASPITLSISVPATQWDAPHTFAFRPNVSTVDSSGREVYGDVFHPTTTLVRVIFSAPMSGTITLS